MQYKYSGWGKYEPELWAQAHYRHDDQKQNLLWLVHPVVDSLRHKPWEGDIISTDIDTQMSTDIRDMLKQPPRRFVELFLAEDRWHYSILQNWPENWPQIMQERATEATNRLRGDLPANVFAVDFQQRVRYA
jgi:hypothetical protein